MALQIFVTRHFDRYARKSGLSDRLLIDAVMRAERGLIDARLGRFLIKQRVPRPGQGRSGGYRTLIAYRKDDIAVFISIFAKSNQANVSDEDLVAFEDIADGIAQMTPIEISRFVAEGKWRPVHVVH